MEAMTQAERQQEGKRDRDEERKQSKRTVMPVTQAEQEEREIMGK